MPLISHVALQKRELFDADASQLNSARCPYVVQNALYNRPITNRGRRTSCELCPYVRRTESFGVGARKQTALQKGLSATLASWREMFDALLSVHRTGAGALRRLLIGSVTLT